MMGSAQRLPNGNTLINWGTAGDITEMRPNNEIAYNLHYTNQLGVNIYSAYRVITRMEATSKNISSIGTYSFNSEGQTGVSINVTNISGNGKASVEKHFYSPQNCNFIDSTFSNILPYRWQLNYTGIISFNGILKFNASSIEGLIDASKTTIYTRDKEGIGKFQELITTYNASTNEIVAYISKPGEFVIGVSYLESPELLYPAMGATVLVKGKVKWSTERGAQKYQLQIDTLNSFSNPKINKIIIDSTSYNYDSLEYSSTYFWRVRSINGKDTSDWSDIAKFNTEIARPSLLSPANNAQSIRLNSTLEWNSVAHANKYRIQVSHKNLFSEILYDISDITTTQVNLKQLNNNTYYYWRVMVETDNNENNWSDIWMFRTIMSTPSFEYPLKSSINIPTKLIAKWDKVNGTTSYLVQLSKNPNFSSEMILSKEVDSTQKYLDKLINDTEYYLRVRAVRKSDSSDWSEIFNFHTKLSVPNLIYPESQTANISTNCTFLWESQNFDSQYVFQLCQTSDFSALVTEIPSLQQPKIYVKDLNKNSKYYWRVKSKIEDKESDWSPTWYFITSSGTNLAAPKLISPKDNSESYIHGTLIWAGVEGATNFKIQVSENSNFNTIVKDTIVSEIFSYNYYKLIVDKKYFWRIRSLRNNDSSDWSTVWSFLVSKKSEMVQLKSPMNDEMQVGLQGELIWESIPGAMSYELQLSNSSDFINIIVNMKNLSSNVFNYSKLEVNQTYYWRVRFNREKDTSVWSNVWSFNTLTNSVLNLPVLLSPIDGMIPVPVNGELKWDHVAGAEKYFVTISKSSTFDEIIFRSEVQSLSVKYNKLDFNSHYYWRIAGVNDTSKSNWSPVYSFTTELEAPQIVSPKDSEENLLTEIDVLWSVQEDISLYTVQIALDEDFANILLNISNISELKYSFSLDENTTYYCRVRAMTNDNYSRWSNVVKFKTYDPNSVLVKSDIEGGATTFWIYPPFPNPTKSDINFRILWSKQITLEKIKFALYDVRGTKIVDFHDISANYELENLARISLEISQGIKGLYYLRANYEGFYKTYSVVIE